MAIRKTRGKVRHYTATWTPLPSKNTPSFKKSTSTISYIATLKMLYQPGITKHEKSILFHQSFLKDEICNTDVCQTVLPEPWVHPQALTALSSLSWDLRPPTSPLWLGTAFKLRQLGLAFVWAVLYVCCAQFFADLNLLPRLPDLISDLCCDCDFLIPSLLASPQCYRWICSPCSDTQAICKFGFR